MRYTVDMRTVAGLRRVRGGSRVGYPDDGRPSFRPENKPHGL